MLELLKDVIRCPNSRERVEDGHWWTSNLARFGGCRGDHQARATRSGDGQSVVVRRPMMWMFLFSTVSEMSVNPAWRYHPITSDRE